MSSPAWTWLLCPPLSSTGTAWGGTGTDLDRWNIANQLFLEDHDREPRDDDELNRAHTAALNQGRVDDIEWLQPEDIADAVSYIVTRPRRVIVNVNEIVVRPTHQGS